jgi:hypothetical protein
MKILARHTQPITREQLQQELQIEVYTSEITKALESLLRRSLVEIIRHSGQQLFTLEPIVMKYVIREYLSSEQNTHLVKFIPSHSNLPLQPQPLPQLESPQPSLAIVNSQQPSNLVRARPNILPVVQENDFLPPISLWTQLGGLFLAGAVGIAIALAAVTPYKVTVQAQANIRPAGELRLVEAETEGSVIDIRAKENQIVKKGDILEIRMTLL